MWSSSSWIDPHRMFDTSLDRIRVQPNSMGTVLYYIVLCIGNQENDFGSRCCSCRTFRKSFAFPCTSNFCHMVRRGRTVKSCTHDLKPNPFWVALCGNASTKDDASSSSFVVACSPGECLAMEDQLLPFDKTRRPDKSNEKCSVL